MPNEPKPVLIDPNMFLIFGIKTIIVVLLGFAMIMTQSILVGLVCGFLGGYISRSYWLPAAVPVILGGLVYHVAITTPNTVWQPVILGVLLISSGVINFVRKAHYDFYAYIKAEFHKQNP